MIEILLTLDLTPKLAIRRCVLGKDYFIDFLSVPSSLPIVVAQTDKRLANRTLKRLLSLGVVKQTQSAWFIRLTE